MEAEVPMPTDEKEIDEKFAEIVVIEFPWKYWILVKERIQPILEDTIDLLLAALKQSCKRSAENQQSKHLINMILHVKFCTHYTCMQ